MKKIISALIICLSPQLLADNLIETATGININDTDAFRELGLHFSGWISMGVGYASHNSGNHDNFPLTFVDRHSEFQLNQVNLSIQAPVDTESPHWDWGGQIDFMIGTDARFPQSVGLDNEWISEDNMRFYDLALPQAFLELHAPIGNGLTIKLGHFYTIIGYEVVTAPDNFFFSHAYTMQYAEPFTHTGALMQYPLNSNFSLSFGAVMGWDNSEEEAGSWNFLGGVSWANDDADTSVAFTMINGPVSDSQDDHRSLFSLVLTQQWTDEITWVLQHDFGFHEDAGQNQDDAYWFGINQYLFYQFNDSLAFGLRAEWFRDADDARLGVGAPTSYYGISGGINWSPLDWATLRPEIRYDWADSAVDVYDSQTEDDLLTFSIDLIIEL